MVVLVDYVPDAREKHVSLVKCIQLGGLFVLFMLILVVGSVLPVVFKDSHELGVIFFIRTELRRLCCSAFGGATHFLCRGNRDNEEEEVGDCSEEEDDLRDLAHALVPRIFLALGARMVLDEAIDE